MKDDVYTNLPDEILVRLLRTDDEKAYQVVYLRYWRSLFSIASWKTNDPIAAEELVQELFLSIWENRHQTLIGNLEAYLKTALRYAIINYIRERLAKQQVDLADSPDVASAQLADAGVGIEELSAALEKAMGYLPEKTRLVFQLSRFENRSIADIAKHLGLTERAVEYHITQSLRTLRVHLKSFLSYSWFLCWLFR